MNSEDLQMVLVVLEVARQGSISRAAEGLGMSQPTVSRLVRAFEASLGTSMFVRHARGVRPTPRAEAILESARHVEEAMRGLERVARGVNDEVAGEIRIAASEIIGVEVLLPRVADLRASHPALNVAFVLGNLAVDLEGGEADIAVRLFRPRGLSLVARRVGCVPTGFYASRAYLDAHGRPGTLESLLDHELIGFDPRGPMRELFSDIDARFTPERFRLATDSLTGQLVAARSGAGIAVLQDPIAQKYPELERVEVGETPGLPLWTTTHEDLRDAPHVRAALVWLQQVLEAYVGAEPWLEAEEPGGPKV
ncbi:LysR family transcriptional regulator [Lujinxingia litoralis]|uniref:LysR family transcriptional regulator n=1 Tax=Lujinxingia litoralis TaxID=2211119 RepID=A0A328CBV1_9DELT|nr:LysR family transcriptional regulator [Lujinxingia litoralis]RAL25146.1 LysR family transcriptional regulator [Lujinxingia litoralis]